jgi:DNA-binding transcriptional LysR family regulator
MPRASVDWVGRIGRRLALRDLHVFFTVVQLGSMAKAARQLNVTQPAVSKAIADLEHTLGVRILDRRPRGVEPTVYGRALLKRSAAAFDELRQSIRDIDFLADPTVGEVQIGCLGTLMEVLLQPVILSFSRQYPGVVLRVEDSTPALELAALRDRRLDFVVRRMSRSLADEPASEELDAELLFQDELVVVAGPNSRLASRRKIDLAELVSEPWILSEPRSWNYAEIASAFRTRDLGMPKLRLETLSTPLRLGLVAAGPYIATFPRSVLQLYADRYSLKALPIDCCFRPWPVAIVTLKNRTLSPVVARFIECTRQVARSIGGSSRRQALDRPRGDVSQEQNR